MPRPNIYDYDIDKIKKECNKGLGYTLKEVAQKLKYRYHSMNKWIKRNYLKRITIDFLPIPFSKNCAHSYMSLKKGLNMKKLQYYILENKKVKVAKDIYEWAQFFEKGNRILKQEDIKVNDKNYFVSTVFLGLNQNFFDGPPLLFETMVFAENGSEEYCDRYSTYEEAEKGHQKAVEYLKML